MQKNVAGQYVSLRAFNSSTGAPVTGDAANITFYVQKDNGSVTAIAAAVTEVSATNMPGVYKALLTQADTNGDCVLICGKSSTSNVVIADKEYATTPANFATTVINNAGAISVANGLKKNQALAGFPFPMTDSTAHAPATGKSVSVYRRIDGGAEALVGAATELANGLYKIDFAASDLNGTVIAVRCTATGCDDLNFDLIPAT